MSAPSDPKFLRGLVDELRKLPAETPWVEFKRNKAVPEEIGEYLLTFDPDQAKKNAKYVPYWA